MWPGRWGGSSNNGEVVTDRIALILAAAIVALVATDALANDASVMLFLGQKFVKLVEYMAFWR